MEPTRLEENKKRRKKKENPYKREYGIEIVEGKSSNLPIKHTISIDIGFTTTGITWFDHETGKLTCIPHSKKESKVQGMKIVDLLKLCKITINSYFRDLPVGLLMNEKVNTRIILEEPLLIMGQRSFSVSLYVLLGKLIEFIINEGFHSIVLVRPGSAKKLLGFKSNVKMPDSEKTKWVKENLPNIGCKNNHQADSVFSNILVNYEEISKFHSCVNLLNKVEYKIYTSNLVN